MRRDVAHAASGSAARLAASAVPSRTRIASRRGAGTGRCTGARPQLCSTGRTPARRNRGGGRGVAVAHRSRAGPRPRRSGGRSAGITTVGQPTSAINGRCPGKPGQVNVSRPDSGVLRWAGYRPRQMRRGSEATNRTGRREAVNTRHRMHPGTGEAMSNADRRRTTRINRLCRAGYQPAHGRERVTARSSRGPIRCCRSEEGRAGR